MSKSEADYTKRVDVFWLNKHDYFNGWKKGGIKWMIHGQEHSIGVEAITTWENHAHVRLFYTNTSSYGGEVEQMDYKVPLVTTPCYFGGVRYWFICPMYSNGIYCGRRVGTLYSVGKYFVCRHCGDLTYSARKYNRRSHYYSFKKYFDTIEKIEELEMQNYTEYYAGKPTKKHKKYMNLAWRLRSVSLDKYLV